MYAHDKFIHPRCNDVFEEALRLDGSERGEKGWAQGTNSDSQKFRPDPYLKAGCTRSLAGTVALEGSLPAHSMIITCEGHQSAVFSMVASVAVLLMLYDLPGKTDLCRQRRGPRKQKIGREGEDHREVRARALDI